MHTKHTMYLHFAVNGRHMPFFLSSDAGTGIARPLLRRLRLGLPVCCRPADDLLPSLSINHLVASREAYRICVKTMKKVRER